MKMLKSFHFQLRVWAMHCLTQGAYVPGPSCDRHVHDKEGLMGSSWESAAKNGLPTRLQHAHAWWVG